MKKTKVSTSPSEPKSKDRRKFMRFEFTSPVLFRLISIVDGVPRVEPNVERAGELLDISAGGALLASKKPVAEGNYISLNLNLKGIKEVEGILGKVKRIEESEQSDFLMGIEFCSIESLPEIQRQTLAQKNIRSFDRKIREAIVESVFLKRKNQIKT